ncbi:hypothetical protein GU926_10585 [Nibribacter ruber]|uniref:Uncharacterized protein n=1 Tax=Nibribacter ruber TaxID=2698458 RepID=A0A6P1P1U9_9BACT|nr:hypothetical protein [Nibribacter ruber]QHL87852.1 hypothetical protein GU926_10585 [Nibribacter ruber]
MRPFLKVATYLMNRICVSLVLMFVCMACRRPCGFYDEVEQVPVAPSAEALAGIYMPDNGTVNRFKTNGPERQDYGHIELTQDKKFILVNTSGLVVGESRNRIVSDTGKLELSLDSVSGTQDISVLYQAGGQLNGKGDGQIRLYKKDGKLVLFKYTNDPDQCEYVMYEKQ